MAVGVIVAVGGTLVAVGLAVEVGVAVGVVRLVGGIGTRVIPPVCWAFGLATGVLS